MSKQIITEFPDREMFKQFISNYNGVVIVKFGAQWCGPCNYIKPLVLDLYNKMPENVILADIDIDENEDVYAYSKIKTIPTMVSYVNGDKMDINNTSNSDDIIAFFNKCEGHATFSEI